MSAEAETDIGVRLTDLANKLSATNNEIQKREEQFEREIGELRRTRADLARELQALTLELTGDIAPRPVPGARRRAVGERQSLNERADQVLDIVRAHPQGVNGKQVAEELGVSNATATKAINVLLERAQIRAEGERRGRKLLPT
jgi:predicted HTH transcriptional regulator